MLTSAVLHVTLAPLHVRLADVVRQIRRGSSAWIHEHGINQFAWQQGYGAFTVSPSQLAKVQQYIANQIAHHRTKTLDQEYFDLLRLSGVEFDERYYGDNPRTTPVVREYAPLSQPW
jgi:putative transposase